MSPLYSIVRQREEVAIRKATAYLFPVRSLANQLRLKLFTRRHVDGCRDRWLDAAPPIPFAGPAAAEKEEGAIDYMKLESLEILRPFDVGGHNMRVSSCRFEPADHRRQPLKD